MNDFEKELISLINRYSKENGSDTPDYILGEYLIDCLNTFNKTLQKREKWYDKEISLTKEPEDVFIQKDLENFPDPSLGEGTSIFTCKNSESNE